MATVSLAPSRFVRVVSVLLVTVVPGFSLSEANWVWSIPEALRHLPCSVGACGAPRGSCSIPATLPHPPCLGGCA